ncbi:MAG: ABC transporter permease [Candidatus Berkiella sp.]
MLNLALLQLWRSRNITEFRILSAALILATFAVTLLSCLIQGFSDLFVKDASTMLGADLVIEAPHSFSDTVKNAIAGKGLAHSENVEFFSMLTAKKGLQLANVNGIRAPFPLRGKLLIETPENKSIETTSAPKEGEIWLEQNLLGKLGAQLNEIIQVGNLSLKITGVIKARPLALSGGNILAPLCYVNINDVNKMAVLQPGSRATYRLLLNASGQSTKNLQATLKPLLSTDATWVTPQSGRRGLGQTIEKVQQYLSVILLIQVLLAGIAIAICAHEYSDRQKRNVALMRCLGAKSNTIIAIHLLQLVTLCGLTMIIGIGSGYGVAAIVLNYAKTLGYYGAALNAQGAMLGALTGLLLLLGFALPPIYELRKIAPSQIFQNNFTANVGLHLISYVAAVLSLLALLFMSVSDPNIALRLCVQVFILGATIYAIAYGMWYVFLFMGRYGGLVWRFGLTYLQRHRQQAINQWLVFTIVVMLLLLVQIIKHDFLQQWRTQLPSNAPNYFLLNVQQEQIDPLKKWFTQHGIDDVTFYPIVRGRMSHINSQPVGSHRGLSRPINLTWMTQLPKDNQVLAGEQWGTSLQGQPVISIEHHFAQRQGLSLNDSVSFQIENEIITAKIVQMRSLEWQSFKPNFFVIFPEGVLNEFAHSYITSIYVPKEFDAALLALAKDYVEISIIDIDSILQNIREMVIKISTALEGLLLIVFLLGILIMYASLLSSLKERMQESAMLQILGANKAFIGKLLVIEFGLLGLFCGIVGSGMAMLLAKDLAQSYFGIQFMVSAKWFWYGTLLSTLVITFIGLLGARKVFHVSPLWLLRQNS